MERKQYVVLGLGVFGSTIAKTLSKYGYEVVAIDKDSNNVERIADYVTKAVIADTTSYEEMESLGLEDMDVAIVAIGNSLEAAVLTTMLVKEMKIPYVVAKAKNKQAKLILEKVGADKVVRPEKDMGLRTAKRLLRKDIVDLVELDDNYSIVEMNAPKKWIGNSLEELNVRVAYQMNILGVKTGDQEELVLNIGANYRVKEEDRFLLLGKTDIVEKFDMA